MKFLSLLVLSSLALSSTSCGDDEALFTSGQVSVKLNLKEGDVVSERLEDRKNISTESSNPYGAFLNEVDRTFGDSPREIRVEEVSIEISETKDDVATLADLWPGSFDVFFAADDSVSGYTIATASSATNVGPITMTLDENVNRQEVQDLLNSGNFRVGVRGNTEQTSSAKFDTTLNITTAFGVYER